MKSNASKLPTQKPEATDQTSVVDTIEISTVLIEIPYANGLGAPSFQDDSNRLDLGKLSKDQLRKVKSWRRGLVNKEAKLNDGGIVKSNRDAILWMIDNADC